MPNKPTTLRELKEEFNAKCLDYDKDGGFRVYVEDYDNQDIDIDLQFKWFEEKLTSYNTELLQKIEEWKYSYDNYPTMMATKNNFEKGKMARELASEVINLITQEK